MTNAMKQHMIQVAKDALRNNGFDPQDLEFTIGKLTASLYRVVAFFTDTEKGIKADKMALSNAKQECYDKNRVYLYII